MKQYQYNEKPTNFKNIGEDIEGAARHHRDTYETPDELRKKASEKKSKADIKELTEEYKGKLKTALTESTKRAQDILKEYELRKALLLCGDFVTTEIKTFQEFRAFVTSKSGKEREDLRKIFNRSQNKAHKIRYIRPIELGSYFEPKKKNSFREVNGHEVQWRTDSKTFDSEYLSRKVKGVQFGNSLTENERIYVCENLTLSIAILEKYFNFDFSEIGFSYGARGRAGSIAPYQDSSKVLAFNRGWDGALIHELGHAIDYKLGLVSRTMPWSIRKKYIQKLEGHPFLKTKIKYYGNPKEIFARMLERYALDNIKEKTSFLIFLEGCASLPDFDDETKAWFFEAIGPVLKGGAV